MIKIISKSSKYLFWALLLIFTLLSKQALSDSKPQIRVAVASNFYHSLQQLLSEETELPFSPLLSSGSTGLLYAQVLKGAPFDVFLAADEVRPQLLQDKGLTTARRTYARGKLVLWPVSDSNKSVNQVLQQYSGKLAIANPKLAPYGAAAIDVIQSLGLEGNFKRRLVLGSNVNQAFQFVDSGNLGLAFIAESQLLQAKTHLQNASRKNWHYLAVAEGLHQSITQQLVVLKRTKQLDSAKALVNWLTSKRIQTKLAALGYLKVND